MSLDKGKLKDGMETLFLYMKDGVLNDDSIYSDTTIEIEDEKTGEKQTIDVKSIPTICKEYIEQGEISTVDNGKIATGTVTGAQGSGSITVQDSVMRGIMKTTIDLMKANAGTPAALPDSAFAICIQTGLVSMVTAGVVETEVSGEAINEQTGVSTPFVKSAAKGVLDVSASSAALLSSINDALANMSNAAGKKDNPFDDSYLAGALADGIHTMVSAGKVTTAGLEDILGLSGQGGIQ